MSITPFQSLACPLDGTPLHCTGSSWACASGHSFDIASQGYINLLPVQHKRSRDAGGSKEMVAARRRFLTVGYYQPIAAAVSRAVLAGLPADATISCLDAAESKGLGSNNFQAKISSAWPLCLARSNWFRLSISSSSRGGTGTRSGKTGC